jgi:hypothetical protein
LYSQQRVDVDACARLLGPGFTSQQLKALIAEGFLGSVDYLFWDDEDPARVTLKVSHESFIRGWQRFRDLIDQESEHFDQFLGLLRKCAAWVTSGHSEDFLLETGEMRRLSESKFERRLARPEQHEIWMRFLQLDRDGGRLARVEPQLLAFLATSNTRLRERELRQSRSRRNWLLLGAATLLLAPSALFSMLIQGPVTERAELLFDAGNRANRAPLTADYPGHRRGRRAARVAVDGSRTDRRRAHRPCRRDVAAVGEVADQPGLDPTGPAPGRLPGWRGRAGRAARQRQAAPAAE